MDGYFHNRSAYCVLDVPVPECFTELERLISARYPSKAFLPGEQPVALAENLCRRMSNLDFFADLIEKSFASRDDTRRAWSINALLVAHFSACKSLLDAGAIALATLYSPRLANNEMDFAKGKLWQVLETSHPDVYKRYKGFRPWITKEVVVWRDAAVHRLAPLVIAQMKRNTDGVLDTSTMTFPFPLEPDIDYARLWQSKSGTLEWGEPLHLHKEWRYRFVDFCTEICRDIALSMMGST